MTFKASGVSTIAGSYVLDDKIVELQGVSTETI